VFESRKKSEKNHIGVNYEAVTANI
jgi:hypothetical protein